MFQHNPELKDIFNMSNQRTGDQREALFNAICAYATNIDNLPALLTAVEKIAHKHSSFLISAEQYGIVGQHLLATIDELFSPGQEVLDAWGEAYQVLANVFIQREEQIYQENEQQSGGWRGLREFELVEKTKESESVCSFTFQPVDGEAVCGYKPGQYIGIYINSDLFDNQEIRQYSLSSAVRENSYRISVKREQSGKVSNYLHEHLQVGDKVKLAAPAGDFFMQVEPTTPVVLISAGVGLTPTLAMLETLTDHQAPITWVHAAENGHHHPFKQHVNSLVNDNEKASSYVWYNEPTESDELGKDYQFKGLVNLDEIEVAMKQPNAQFYFCGPVGFMQYVAKQLLELGVSEQQCHYECFGPHKVI